RWISHQFAGQIRRARRLELEAGRECLQVLDDAAWELEVRPLTATVIAAPRRVGDPRREVAGVSGLAQAILCTRDHQCRHRYLLVLDGVGLPELAARLDPRGLEACGRDNLPSARLTALRDTSLDVLVLESP